MIAAASEVFDIADRDFIYQFVDVALAVDVGAAAGSVTRVLADRARRVVAFEPYPPNWQYFGRTVAGCDNVELVTKAVADRVGSRVLHVASSVSGSEPGWEGLQGYSSVGTVVGGLRSRTNALRRRGRRIKVATTTLDAEFSEPIGFLKIDVQGAEALVLAGARQLLCQGMIQLAYVEWSGDPEVERLLDRHYLYDSHYVGESRKGPGEFESAGLEVVGELDLSTGRKAYLMVNRKMSDVGNTLRRLNEGRGQWIQTDLVASLSPF